MELKSIKRSLDIIDFLSRKPRGMRLSDISSALGLNMSTTHHILQTLSGYSYVMQDSETKKYSLGYRFLEIGRRILDSIDIRKIARKYLEELHEACKEAVRLSIYENDKVIFIDKIEAPSGVTLATYLGYAILPHASASGKVLLSAVPDEKIRNIYQGKTLEKANGKNTITDLGQLLEELEKVRKQGYAIDDEEYYEGIRCMAAPVRAGGKVVAAISVTGSIFSLKMERIEKELKYLVIKTAESISAELKW